MNDAVPTLIHITIDSGHMAKTSRADVSDAVVAALQHIVDDESGAIAPGFSVDIIRPINPATRRPAGPAAAFTVQWKQGGPALATNIVCWGEDVAADAWRMLHAPVEAPMTGRPIVCPQQTPWLATMLLPGASLAPDDAIATLADMERCLAWTIIETPI